MKVSFLVKILAVISIMAGFSISLSAQAVELNGAGATFPDPLYKKMFDEYNKKTGVKVNYQGIGSGGGIKQLTEKTIDFGGTDAFMSDDEISKTGAAIIHIPTCEGAVVVTYNLPGSPKLKLTGDIISDIFLGKITKWDDKKIVKENKNVKLPDLTISVVHRSDSSGTSYVFTDYLTKVSKEWAEKVGTNKSPNWPAGLGGKGNPGVSEYVKQIPGSIGYVELVYVLQNKMPYADIKNKSGNFITPSLESVSLATNVKLPADTRISITDTDAKNGYPISTFTWLILYKEQNYNNRNVEVTSALVKMLSWIITDGQSIPKTLDYAPLSKAAVDASTKLIKSVTYNGKPIVK
jgi:phosphate transport system substrate-binding protein